MKPYDNARLRCSIFEISVKSLHCMNWFHEITSFYSHDSEIKLREIQFTIFLSNQLFSSFFSKTVTFTKFLPKKWESTFPLFPHCVHVAFSSTVWKFRKFTHTHFLLKKFLKSWFHEKRFQWERISCFSTLCHVVRIVLETEIAINLISYKIWVLLKNHLTKKMCFFIIYRPQLSR